MVWTPLTKKTNRLFCNRYGPLGVAISSRRFPLARQAPQHLKSRFVRTTHKQFPASAFAFACTVGQSDGALPRPDIIRVD